MKLNEINFKKQPIFYQWHETDIDTISHAEIAIQHDTENFRLLGSLELIENFNGNRMITGFSYDHKIIYNQPNLDSRNGLEVYEKAMKAIIEFRKIHQSLDLGEDESDFITLEKKFFFISPIFLDTGLRELESQISSILRRWIEKISEITHDDDLVLIEKEEVIKIDN